MRDRVARMMEEAWREPGFCVPNPATYPHQWLWDSCFHALVWLALDSDRALTEVEHTLARQDATGFVPHMTYWHRPRMHEDFWGRPGTSVITQPPMYGHTLAEIGRAGLDVPAPLVERAVKGIGHLLHQRTRTPAGLVPVFHPWETGCDDSLRWDSFLRSPAGTAYEPEPYQPEPGEPESGEPEPADRVARWKKMKGELVAELVTGEAGHAEDAPRFRVGSIGFNALVAWNGRELIDAFPEAAAELGAPIAELEDRIRARWNGRTWVDDGPASGRARTLDAMTALFVDPRPEAFAALVDDDAFGAPYGPRGADRREPAYRPDVYWRGPAWPQLGYLVMVAAARAGESDTAVTLGDRLVAGAERSGLAEYWHPDRGDGLGAVPQTWAGLALLVG